MASVKKKKLLGFIFTVVAVLIFIALSAVVIILTLDSGQTLTIENITLMVLQFVAFALLLVGMIIRKENLILGTLVAALASSTVSYMVSDINDLLTSVIDFTGPWYASAISVTNLVVDGLLCLGTVTFLIYLLNGHRSTTRSLTSLFFLCYLSCAFLEIIFIVIGSIATDAMVIVLLAFLSDVFTTFAFLVDIDAYFFRKDNDSIASRIQESRDQRHRQKLTAKTALSSLEEVIANYQTSILPVAFKEKNGHFELTIDLRDVPLFEDCSGGTLLNSSIYSFVEDVAFSLGGGHEIAIHFLFKDGTSVDEQKKVAAIFRAHYAIHYKNLRDKLTKEMILAITFVFAGFLLITFHLPYVAANDNSVYGEMLDIFGWVFTWEAVEILCVNSLENQSELHQYQLLYTAQIDEEKGAPLPSPKEN